MAGQPKHETCVTLGPMHLQFESRAGLPSPAKRIFLEETKDQQPAVHGCQHRLAVHRRLTIQPAGCSMQTVSLITSLCEEESKADTRPWPNLDCQGLIEVWEIGSPDTKVLC
jgi:hypothetical protein